MSRHEAKAVVVMLAMGAVVIGCARRAPGTDPPAMSAAQHEAAAHAERGRAEIHAAQYDPNATATEESCPDLLGSPACWSWSVNPTKEHLDRAEEHRRLAAEHRAASVALREAEAGACTGISPRDRDESPFDHREDIAAVGPLHGAEPGTPAGPGFESGTERRARLEGAVITFRPVRGMTAQWLQRIVDCHLARAAALGHVVPEMPYCPLVLRGVSATVRAAPDGFAVAIRASDTNTAREVWRRAEALGPAAGPAGR